MATERKIDVIIKLQNLMTAELKRAADDTAEFGEKLKSTGAKMTAYGVAATAALTGMMKVTGDFEQSLSDVSTLLDVETMPKIDEYREGIKDLGTDLPVALDDVSGALYQVISATGDAEGAMQTLTASSKLGVAGLGGTTQSVEMLTAAMNSFQMNAEEMDDAANIIFKTVKWGKTTVGELARTFGTIAPMAAAVGVRFDELQAATAALTSTGMRTRVAQTQLRSVMSSLLKPSEALKGAMVGIAEDMERAGELTGPFVDEWREARKVHEANKLALDQVSQALKKANDGTKEGKEEVKQLKEQQKELKKAVNGSSKAYESASGALSKNIIETKGLGGLLDELQTITKGNSTAMAKLIPNVRGLGAVMALTGPVAEKYDIALKDMKADTDSLTEAVEKQAATLNSQTLMAWNNIKAMVFEFGKTLEPVAIAIVKLFSDMIDMVRAIPEPLKTVATHVALLTAAFLSIAGPIMTAVGTFLTLKAALASAGIAIGAIVTVTGTILAPIAAVAAALTGLYLLWKKWDDIRDMFKLAISAMYFKMKEWADKVPIMVQMAVQKIIDTVTMIGPKFEKFWYTITGQDAKASKIQDVSDEYIELGFQLKAIEKDYQNQARAEKEAILLGEEQIQVVENTAKATDKLIESFQGASTSVGELAKETIKYGDEAKEVVEKVDKEVKKVSKSMTEQKEEIEQSMQAMQSYGSKGWTATSSKAENFKKKAKEALEAAQVETEKATEKQQELTEEVIKGTDAYKDMEDRGREAIGQLTDKTVELQEEITGLKSKMQDMAETAAKSSAEAVKSMDEVQKAAHESFIKRAGEQREFVNSYIDEANKVTSVSEKLVEAVEEAVEEALPELRGVGGGSSGGREDTRSMDQLIRDQIKAVEALDRAQAMSGVHKMNEILKAQRALKDVNEAIAEKRKEEWENLRKDVVQKNAEVADEITKSTNVASQNGQELSSASRWLENIYHHIGKLIDDTKMGVWATLKGNEVLERMDEKGCDLVSFNPVPLGATASASGGVGGGGGASGGPQVVYQDNRQTNINRSQMIANDRTAMEQLARQIDKKGSGKGSAYDLMQRAAAGGRI